MRIFYGEGRVNFVDENDVYVGFAFTQCCCEEFGFSINTTAGRYVDEEEKERLSDYFFDRSFSAPVKDKYRCNDGGDARAFRLVADGKEDLILTIWNKHNGYYSHGFEVKVGGETVERSWL